MDASVLTPILERYAMQTVRRILVAVKEPHARSLPAVAKAAQLARAYQAQLELFHALSAPIYLTLDGVESGALNQMEHVRRVQVRSRLEAIAGPLRKLGIQVTTHSDWDYPAGEAIVRRAARIRADCIVAECHAGTRRGWWPLKLTDWDVLRFSAVPVLLVRSKRAWRHPVILAAVDPAHAFDKPAKLDDAIIKAADSVRKAFRGTLHAVHAYVPLPSDAKGSEILSPEATKILQARARAHARARMTPLFKKVKLPRARQHLMGEHPINAIPELADKIGCDIVVMGAVSRSGIKRIFIGNTAERMIDELKCDVLIVKPPGFESRVKRILRGPQVRAVLPMGDL
jgi:universal stress protein E